MKNDGTNGHENADGFDSRDDAALWDLLGRSPNPKTGPYFARRVLREVNLHEEAHPAESITATGSRWWQPAALWRACRRLPRTAFLAGAPVAALLLLFLGLRMNPVGGAATTQHAVATSSNDDDAMPDAVRAPVNHLTGGNLAVAELPDDISAQDVEVIADLDNLLKREESRLWTEDDTARF